MALLPGIRSTSKIYLLTATLADKDNQSFDTLLSDNLKIAKNFLLKGSKFISDGSLEYPLYMHMLSLQISQSK